MKSFTPIVSLFSFVLILGSASAVHAGPLPAEATDDGIFKRKPKYEWLREGDRVTGCVAVANPGTRIHPLDCIKFMNYSPRLVVRNSDGYQSQVCIAHTVEGLPVIQIPSERCSGDYRHFKTPYEFSKDTTYRNEKCVRVNSEGERTMVPFDRAGNFIQDCAPEVIYSWKTASHMESILEEYRTTGILKFRTFWGARTPLSSFGYGDFVVRAKLKPGTQFILNTSWDSSGGCDRVRALGDGREKNTIAIGYYNEHYVEYNACDPEVFDSWSWGTPEILVEMIKERKWIETHARTQWDRLHTVYNDLTTYFGFHLDGKDWSETHLNWNFHVVKDAVAKVKGGVFGSNPEAHYASSRPDYFHFLHSKEIKQCEISAR